MADLARVFDEGDLDRIAGGRASFEITVPAPWADRTCEVAVPRRLACALCEGGGCDACERRGGYRLEGTERRVTVRLPSVLGGRTRIRIGRPFGADSVIGVLLLDVVLGEEPSASCSVVPEPEQPLARASEQTTARNRAVFAAVATLVLVVLLIFLIRGVVD